MTTTDKAKQLIEIAKKATPGPWSHDLDCEKPDSLIEEDNHSGGVCWIQTHGSINTIARTGEEFSHADARYIAASDPTTVTEICEAYLDMKEAYEHVCKDCDREHGIVVAKIARIQELEASVEWLKGARDGLAKEREAFSLRNMDLVEALEYYADWKKYKLAGSGEFAKHSEMELDMGHTAVEALAKAGVK